MDLSKGDTIINNGVDINDFGEVAVSVKSNNFGAAAAGVWNEDSVIIFGQSGSGGVVAIDNQTQVIGIGSAVPYVYLWDHGLLLDFAALTGLGLNPYYIHLEEGGINDSGHIVFNTVDVTAMRRYASLWKGGSLVELEPNESYSYARRVNNRNHVLGKIQSSDNTEKQVIWHDGTFTELVIPGISVSPRAFNDSDDVVGDHYIGGTSTSAFLWKKGVVTDLNALVAPNSGWDLQGATGINNKGEIVGSGNHNGKRASFLLTKAMQITRPRKDELWIARERDTIRWIGSTGQKLNLSYNDDLNGLLQFRIPIAANVPSESGFYVWKIPDGVNSKYCDVHIENADDPADSATSDVFRLRSYEMVRLNPDNSYAKFAVGVDSWNFNNVAAVMWPVPWWTNFSYRGEFSLDPYRNKPYPDVAPFESAMPSDFPDWPLFTETFGTDVCYHTTLLGLRKAYNPYATSMWRSVKGPWPGSCSGLSLSAILGFDRRASVVAKYPAFPSGGNLIDAPLTDSLRLIINSLFVHWEGKQHKDYTNLALTQTTPRSLINDLKIALVDEQADHRYLYISFIDKKGNSGAHAVVPYRFERDTVKAGWYTIWVYDVSYYQMTNAQILIDSTYDSAFAPLWSNSKLIEAFLMEPSSGYLVPPVLSPNAPGNNIPAASGPIASDINVWPDLNSSVRIESPSGGVFKYRSGTVVDSLPGGTYFIPPTGSPSPPAVYTMPDDTYRITLDGFTNDHAQTSIFGDGWAYEYERDQADSLQSDVLNFRNALLVENHDSVTKSISLETIHNIANGDIKYRLSGIALANEDSMSIAQENAEGLKLINYGSFKQSDVLVEKITSDGYSAFQHSGVILADHSAITFIPSDDSVSTIHILIDHGNDGTMDDSLVVDNQITDVKERATVDVPKNYSLSQNYPNPFNPVTTIAYDIPQTSFVTLKVYDLLGRDVATLVMEMKQPGSYSVKWDASNVAAGVYYYRLQTEGFADLKKLLLLK